MQFFITTLFLSLVASFSAHAATMGNDPHAGHGGMHSAAPVSSEAAMVDGVIKKIDKAAGKVTVSHGPLTNLNMPAMTMVFRVKDAAWLDQMQTGGKIRFVADTINGSLTIVRFESSK
jgi:Cu(I)/Ag(I) efflux system protein CusF